MRLSKGDGLICIIARINFFLNKNLNYHNRFFHYKTLYCLYGSPTFNIDKAIHVHYLGIKLKAYTLSLVFMALPPLLQQMCAVMF